MVSVVSDSPPKAKIWWSNSIFFVSVHLAALWGMYLWPPSAVPRATLILSFLVWQSAEFGITVGYHRLYSHRAFRASLGVRILLAALGSAGFQGSIKWWCLRHRLHHRFTDDPVHDPYAATRGFFYSHMGWIFYKPAYSRMELVDRDDLDSDPVVRFQHKYYVPLALFFGFIVPPSFGLLWRDPAGAFIWGGLVSRLAIWHCTFLVNSMAHWEGLQPYSDEDTSRGNLLLALLTSGEGSHNFHHAFPHDFRSGPAISNWDPSKWIILALHWIGLVTGLRRARVVDVQEARKYMFYKDRHGIPPPDDEEPWKGAIWDAKQLGDHVRANPRRCVVLVGGFVIDATGYLGEHPGGAHVLRQYSVKPDDIYISPRDATWAFEGGLNNHSRSARRRMREFRLARFQSEDS